MIGLRDRLASLNKETLELTPLGEKSIDKIIYYVERNNFLQILYTHRIDMLVEINNYFLEQEAYEICAKIRDTVNNNNKATGSLDKL